SPPARGPKNPSEGPQDSPQPGTKRLRKTGDRHQPSVARLDPFGVRCHVLANCANGRSAEHGGKRILGAAEVCEIPKVEARAVVREFQGVEDQGMTLGIE